MASGGIAGVTAWLVGLSLTPEARLRDERRDVLTE